MEKKLFDKLVKKQLITLQSEVEVKRVAKDFYHSICDNHTSLW